MQFCSVDKFTRLVSGVFLLALLLSLQGCAYAPQMDNLKIANLPIAQKQELTQVPFFAQQKYQCGPAALATVINYRQFSIKPDDLVSQVYVPNRQGSFQVEMVAAARQMGLVPYQISPSMKALLKEVNAGNPVLILQNLAFDFYPKWHFAVVVGYNLNTSEIILRSATTKRWITTLRNFEQTWLRSNYWGLVITKPDQLPVTAEPIAWLAGAMDLEKVNQLVAAEQTYIAATKRWPDNEKTWLSLTNLYYQQARYQEALNTLNKVMVNFKAKPLLWNNYAYVLKANQCNQQARQAAACAVRLAPHNQNILDTANEMKSLLDNSDNLDNLDNVKRCEFISCQ